MGPRNSRVNGPKTGPRAPAIGPRGRPCPCWARKSRLFGGWGGQKPPRARLPVPRPGPRLFFLGPAHCPAAGGPQAPGNWVGPEFLAARSLPFHRLSDIILSRLLFHKRQVEIYSVGPNKVAGEIFWTGKILNGKIAGPLLFLIGRIL